MIFELDEEQQKKVNEWCTEIDNRVAKEQMADSSFNDVRMFISEGMPYYGAIGGSLTYQFTPTSIGTVVKVIHGYTNETIDLTDYDSW